MPVASNSNSTTHNNVNNSQHSNDFSLPRHLLGLYSGCEEPKLLDSQFFRYSQCAQSQSSQQPSSQPFSDAFEQPPNSIPLYSNDSDDFPPLLYSPKTPSPDTPTIDTAWLETYSFSKNSDEQVQFFSDLSELAESIASASQTRNELPAKPEDALAFSLLGPLEAARQNGLAATDVARIIAESMQAVYPSAERFEYIKEERASSEDGNQLWGEGGGGGGGEVFTQSSKPGDEEDESEEEGYAPAKRAKVEGGGDGRRRLSKKHMCPYPGCRKEFSRKFNLKTHERTHDPERHKPHRCSFEDCTRRFSREKDLERHVALHTKYTCESCGLVFPKRSELTKHQC